MEWTVNHYLLTIRANQVFQVTITPDLERKRLRHILLEQHRSVIGTQYLNDGEGHLFTNPPLADQTLECLLNEAFELTVQKTKQFNPYDVPEQVYASIRSFG